MGPRIYCLAVQKASIIYNPMARNVPSQGRLAAAAASMADEGWEIDLRPTQSAGHATTLAREAAAHGVDVVVACGGDGTVNEVVNGLVGSQSAVALIRGGTGDVFAKEIGMPKTPEQALRLLAEGERRRFDLGIAGERYFLLMAGVGLDAGVVRRVPGRPKRFLGTASYVLWGALELGRYRSRPVQLRLNGEQDWEGHLYWLLLGNTRSYGGVIDITSEALADDGLLDAYVFSGRGLPWLARTGIRLAMRRHDGADGVSFQRLRELDVLTPGLEVQADGEFFGETPMRFGVAPRAVEVVIPLGAGAKLLAADEGPLQDAH
ncbi:MAG: YegS/Rv2252/BmrU family lipid kinase [Dehalococcoidia bacterium]|nr:YegS/Rv2252/BmrU family lipid kinase [Dehalococcoidia bacterium]